MEKILVTICIAFCTLYYPRQKISNLSIDGSWIMVPGSDGKTTQFKMFHDGFFSLLMQDKDGKWIGAAGKYSIDGNDYKETFDYCTVAEYIGVTDWQELQITNDTLYFKGFKKVIYPDGSDRTNKFEKFYEKRIRAK